jgi:hypothetical protein
MPAATADLIAVVEDSSATGGTGSVPACDRSASSRYRLVPDAGSRLTSAVAASSAAVIPERRRTHGWPGSTTTVRVSVPARRDLSPAGRSGPSTKPRSARPASTAAATSAELPAVSVTVVPGSRDRSTLSHLGSRYSAIVMLAATRSTASRRARSVLMPASSAAAASIAACAQPATSSPAGVSREPRGERSMSVMPSWRSRRRTWVLAAGWEIPLACAARPRLPRLATLSSKSNGARSETRAGRTVTDSVITLCYELLRDCPLPGRLVLVDA